MNGTPWGYIHQKRIAEESSYERNRLENENHKLKEIIKKLLTKQELTDSEKVLIGNIR